MDKGMICVIFTQVHEGQTEGPDSHRGAVSIFVPSCGALLTEVPCREDTLSTGGKQPLSMGSMALIGAELYSNISLGTGSL